MTVKLFDLCQTREDTFLNSRLRKIRLILFRLKFFEGKHRNGFSLQDCEAGVCWDKPMLDARLRWKRWRLRSRYPSRNLEEPLEPQFWQLCLPPARAELTFGDSDSKSSP